MNKEIIAQIKKLKEEGKTCMQVSKQLKLTYSLVFYHYNDKSRQKTIQRQIEYNKNNPGKRDINNYRKYQKGYQQGYYHSTEHHERLKEYHRDYQRKRYNDLKLKGGDVNAKL